MNWNHILNFSERFDHKPFILAFDVDFFALLSKFGWFVAVDESFFGFIDFYVQVIGDILWKYFYKALNGIRRRINYIKLFIQLFSHKDIPEIFARKLHPPFIQYLNFILCAYSSNLNFMAIWKKYGLLDWSNTLWFHLYFEFGDGHFFCNYFLFSTRNNGGRTLYQTNLNVTLPTILHWDCKLFLLRELQNP